MRGPRGRTAAVRAQDLQPGNEFHRARDLPTGDDKPVVANPNGLSSGPPGLGRGILRANALLYLEDEDQWTPAAPRVEFMGEPGGREQVVLEDDTIVGHIEIRCGRSS